MTPWTLIPTDEADKDVAPLARDVRERVARALERWAQSGHGDLVPLRNIAEATHRLRIGDWRVYLRLEPAARTAHVVRVLARGSAYKP